jgi:hypothetical protein
MATLYWVGGTDSWNATAGSKWSLTSGGAGGEAVPTSADDVYIDSGSGSVTVTVNATAVCKDLRFVSGAGSFAGTFAGGSTITMHGSFVASASMTWTHSGFVTAAATTAQTITSNGKALTSNIILDGVSGSWALQDALTTSGSFTLTNGDLDLNDFNLTAGAFNSANTNVRSITSGAGQFYVTAAGTAWTISIVTNLTMVDRATINATDASASAMTINVSNLAESVAPNVNVTASSGTLTLTTNINNLNFTGFSGTLANANRIIYGSYTQSPTMTLAAGANATQFIATSGTQVITSNGVTMDFPLTINAPGATVQLADALTLGGTRTFTLTAGGLDLNGFNLTAGFFASNNSNVRSITSGLGQFYCTAAASSGALVPVAMNTTTNLTLADRPTFNLTGNASGTATRAVEVTSLAESVCPNVNITAGTDTIVHLRTNLFNVDFTGFSGAWPTSASRTIYGNLTVSATMTVTASASTTTFAATSGAQVVTSNGVTLDFPLTINAPGATVQLADALTIGSTRALTLTDGGFNAAGFNVTAGTVAAAATFDTLTMGAGTWTIQGSGASAWSINAAVTVACGTSTVSMTSASAKTFVGAGKTYYNLTQGGAGALTITGANSFNDITNTVQPVSILFTAGTTTTVSNFNLAGTAGNLVTIGSVTAASHTLSRASGTTRVSYCTISYSTATGGAAWQAPTNLGNVDGLNNSGWDFSEVSLGGANNFVSTLLLG